MMMMLLLLGVLLLLIIVFIYTYVKQWFSQSINDLPGKAPQVFFGNLLDSGLLTGRVTFHQAMLNYQRQYGDKFMFWFGSHACPVFCLSEHAQMIFSDRHTFEQSPLFLPNFDLLCPHGIFTLQGARWKRHIRVILPMFKRAKIIHYLDSIVECVDRFIDQYLHENQTHRDLKQHCQSLTMNIIGWIGFNYDLDRAMDSSLKKAMEDFIFQASLVMLIPGIPRWLIRIYFQFNWIYQRARRRIREMTEQIVEQEQNNRHPIEHERPKTLIASMVSSLNEQANDDEVTSGLTRAEMLDEILVSILAGYETTSTALSWFIFYMSKYPHVQQRIKEELREHHLLLTGDVAQLPTLSPDILDSLTYCECVTKEVLRLAPTASATTRIALHDTIVDNVRIQRGQTILIATHNINTDVRYWHHADPTKFVPERFLGMDKDHPPYAMLPFGGGHRGCVGRELAWLELKTIIVRLMQRGVTFEDTPDNTGGFAENVTCFPKTLAVRVRFDRQ